MTPIRAKRTPKAPTRFSSSNDGPETISSTGETILDYTNNTTKTTHTLSPVSKAIRLKTTAREPLKVKLPKLRRAHNEQKATKDTPTSSFSYNSDIKIHKIKLPSLLSKKNKQKSSVPDSSASGSSSSSVVVGSSNATNKNTAQPSINIEQKYSTESISLLAKNDTSNKPPQPVPEEKTNFLISAGEELNVSTASKASQEDKSIANTSFNSSSDGDANASGMKIVVSQPDASSGSEIRCPCGVDDDLGVMVECERCSTWQHGHCINVGQEDDAEAYEGYICAYCHFPKDKFRESLIQLTVGDKFQARFDQLESLIKRNSTNIDERNDMIENNSRLTLEELAQATKELNRVLNSLRAKWRLLTSQAYELELRIWQNPYWTDEAGVDLDKDKTFYFMDKCKRNLRFNIRNMIKQMDTRCRLIEYAIKLADEDAKRHNLADLSHEKRVKSLIQTLETISNSVKEYKAHSVQVLSN